VTVAELTGPNSQYQTYAAGQLATLAKNVSAIRTDLAADDLVAARRDWLAAQLTWEQVGASYDSFGADGQAVDGLPDGLPQGVADKDFVGLHRLEYGLYHGQSAQQLLPIVDQLAAAVTTVRQKLTSDDLAGDPTNLPLRAHEILEDALRDHLSGIDDQGAGAGAAYAETYADTQVTRVVLGELQRLIAPRAPTHLPTITGQLDTLQQALQATRADGQWRAPAETPLAAQQGVNAAIGALLESLAFVPDLLEVPPAH
jgi:high-affinity iron transporter